MSSKVFSGHQPNFMPYMGVIYKMFRSDYFVLDDDVQYSSSGLHNSNFLKVNGQKYKMVIPVMQSFGDEIRNVRICYDRPFRNKLLRTIQMSYSKAKHFDEGYDFIQRCLMMEYEFLSDLNINISKFLKEAFGLLCQLVIASYEVSTDLHGQQRNVFQCKALGCDVYYSGIGGIAYNDEADYNANGIQLVYSDYKPVVYPQVGNGFIENLSVLDYIMNVGYALPEEWKVSS